MYFLFHLRYIFKNSECNRSLKIVLWKFGGISGIPHLWNSLLLRISGRGISYILQTFDLFPSQNAQQASHGFFCWSFLHSHYYLISLFVGHDLDQSPNNPYYTNELLRVAMVNKVRTGQILYFCCWVRPSGIYLGSGSPALSPLCATSVSNVRRGFLTPRPSLAWLAAVHCSSFLCQRGQRLTLWAQMSNQGEVHRW